MKFTEGKDYFFQAEIQSMFGDGEVDVQKSEKYAVKGVRSAAGAVGVVWGRALVVAGVVGVVMLLLGGYVLDYGENGREVMCAYFASSRSGIFPHRIASPQPHPR